LKPAEKAVKALRLFMGSGERPGCGDGFTKISLSLLGAVTIL